MDKNGDKDEDEDGDDDDDDEFITNATNETRSLCLIGADLPITASLLSRHCSCSRF